MPRNQLVSVRRGVLATTPKDRALVKQAKALQRRALEVRAEDAFRRYVAGGRMQDTRELTEDALEAGGEIADRLAVEVAARPFFADELADIASTGARGLRAELRGYIEDGR
jgi:hypothetical protein